MPRNPRYLLNTRYFHVMTQGINKSYIFNNEVDIKHYIKTMYKIKSDYSVEIVAYCIMNNHTHMLISTDNVNILSKLMHRINTSYAQYYNVKYKRVGPLFRDRFKSQEIFDEKQLLNCIKYIFDNPVKAGMCNHASEYAYSNYFDLGNFEIADYDFIEFYKDEAEKCHIVVQKFLNENNLKKEELWDNYQLLKQLLNLAKKIYNISFSRLSKEINISKYHLINLYKNNF